MTLFVTGDVHGDTYFEKMSDPELMKLSKDDFVLVCGDLEVVRADLNERSWCIERLEAMPYSTLFIDGNHEEFHLIEQYPEEEWHGGRVRRISESIRYLKRGQIFDIDGTTVLAIGGAKTFAHARETGLLEGPDPGVPDAVERETALRNLKARKNAVDLVVSHSAPTAALAGLPQRESIPTSEFTDWLQSLAEGAIFERWLFGHYHCDVEPLPRHRCLLNMLYRAEDGALFREPVIEPQKGRRKGGVKLPAHMGEKS